LAWDECDPVAFLDAAADVIKAWESLHHAAFAPDPVECGVTDRPQVAFG
jgi:hypothetical protein